MHHIITCIRHTFIDEICLQTCKRHLCKLCWRRKWRDKTSIINIKNNCISKDLNVCGSCSFVDSFIRIHSHHSFSTSSFLEPLISFTVFARNNHFATKVIDKSPYLHNIMTTAVYQFWIFLYFRHFAHITE